MRVADPWGLFYWLVNHMTRAAILIDGGYFLKRLPSLGLAIDAGDALAVSGAVGQLVNSHLEHLNKTVQAPRARSLLYRCFYYDAVPYLRKGQTAVTKRAIDYAKTPEAHFRLSLFDHLRRKANFALRLGAVHRERAWTLKEDAQKALLNAEKSASDLRDEDFVPGFRQKTVDMKLGLDVATLTLKKQVDTIILVTGDADFVPAAKLARREGVQIVLDPLWRSVSADLFEHIDGLRSGFPRPKGRSADVERSTD